MSHANPSVCLRALKTKLLFFFICVRYYICGMVNPSCVIFIHISFETPALSHMKKGWDRKSDMNGTVLSTTV